ncbi:hypothetical protein HYDPIDRAFT_29611 [Hydnomerulius pinastri MD-312]|uniref:Uncharacterized protein n=1 Tax=Hydnomerulius pinastri MD-312 TaxID=994086 RepID=A0A0C9VCN0_9AGAM|nr:hypothetical protein HYDPIDRAFT_29611 [Hydnomerulius pinastri MD-312]
MSSDLEAPISRPSTSKKDKSSKKPRKSTAFIITDHGKNEGDDPHWAYQPPAGAVLLDHAVEPEEFDWDMVKDDDDTEIWLIRVPDSIKEKHLEGLEVDPPSSSRTARVGGLTRKNSTYDVWSIADDDTDVIGGEELRGVSCLLPRKKKKGKLCTAPKAIARHIIIAAQPPIPAVPEHQPIVHQNPPRPSYPKDVLKHHFTPYGARSGENATSLNVSMDVDHADSPAAKTAQADGKAKEPKGKKRKVEGETPKKSKKHKSGD